MSRSLRYTFGVHALVALVVGLALLVAPGRTLGLFGWAPVDPHLTRVLGAALVALAWASYRALRADDRASTRLLLEAQAVFAVLAAAGLLRQTAGYYYPWYVWTLLGVFIVFSLAWIWALARR